MNIWGSEDEDKTAKKTASLPRVIGLMSLGATAVAVALLPSHGIYPISLILMLAGLYVSGRLMSVGWLPQP